MSRGQAGSVLRFLRDLGAGQALHAVPDRELLERFAGRCDDAAFQALVCRHGPMIYRLCLRTLGSTPDAEDAFQATFLVFARRAATVRRPDAVGSWLFGVARRLAAKIKTAAARRRARDSQATSATPEDPLSQLSLREAQEALDRELDRLPAKYQAPVLLCCLEGLTRDEAAQVLGVPLTTLKSRLEQARTLLRRGLVRRGLTLPGALLAALLNEGRAPGALPDGLLACTVQGAAGVLRGQAPALSARAVALADGVLAGMMVARLKLAAGVILVMLVLGIGAGTLLGPTHAVQDSGRASARDQGQDLPGAAPAKRLDIGQNVAVEIEGKKAVRVLVQAHVCLRAGPLEHLLTRKGTKEHEAILVADLDARDLHAALLLTGAQIGMPTQVRPRPAPASGTAVKITLEYAGVEGKRLRVPARQWVRHAKSGKELEHDWVFVGSAFSLDPGDPAKLRYAANNGDLACVANFESALLDLPVLSSNDNDQLNFEAHTERIPPRDTAVLVVLEPLAGPKRP